VASANEAFVADTNNHRIVRLNPQTGDWREVVIDGLGPPAGAGEAAIDAEARDAGRKAVAPDKAVALSFTLALPANHHLTAGAPLSLKITDGKRTLHTATLSPRADAGAMPHLSAVVPAEALAGRPGELYVTVYYTHCSAGLSAVCTPAKAAWKMAVGFDAAAPAAIELAQ